MSLILTFFFIAGQKSLATSRVTYEEVIEKTVLVPRRRNKKLKYCMC